jgi:hypothetical protein
MCRNIKPLFNFEPPATDEEVAASALQYVRKVSGFRQPSQANQAAFDTAVAEIARITQELLTNLTTKAAPRNRETEVAKARARNQKRFG